MSKSNDDESGVLTVAEARDALEVQTRRHLGVSLDAFLDAADSGTLPDRPIVRHLLMLAGVKPPAC